MIGLVGGVISTLTAEIVEKVKIDDPVGECEGRGETSGSLVLIPLLCLAFCPLQAFCDLEQPAARGEVVGCSF